MKEEQDYIRDISEMRTMMERSTKFLSLSGLAGILAGIYAIAGAFIAYQFLKFQPKEVTDPSLANGEVSDNLLYVLLLGLAVLILAIGSAILLSYKKAMRRREKIWNPTARRMVINMAVPLVAGGLLILVLLSKGMVGLMAPFTLLFYGIAIYSASKFTYEDVRSLGIIQIVLGLISSYFIEYSVLFWALGFGLAHIIYGIYLHYRYER